MATKYLCEVTKTKSYCVAMKTKTKNYCATFRYRIEVFLSFFINPHTWVERLTASCHTGYSLKLRAFFSIRTKIVIVFVVAQQHFVFVQPWLFSLLLSNLYNIVVLT